MNTGRFRLSDLPPITPERVDELRKAADQPIDCSDIPPLPDRFWEDPSIQIGRFYRPRKEATSVRLDADVKAWLRGTGKGWQKRLNAAMRDLMLHGEAKWPATVR
jgi:uncharacterized protein (DUF4415 family)